MRQLVYQVCYNRYYVSFYLWLIGTVLKHCKVLKYYDQDCSQDKCHFLLSLDINTKFSLPASILENSDSQKFLGAIIDRKLNFNERVTTSVIRQAEKFNHSQDFSHIYSPTTPPIPPSPQNNSFYWMHISCLSLVTVL